MAGGENVGPLSCWAAIAYSAANREQLDALASFSYHPGVALAGKYAGHFFLGGKGTIRAFKMVPDGAYL